MSPFFDALSVMSIGNPQSYQGLSLSVGGIDRLKITDRGIVSIVNHASGSSVLNSTNIPRGSFIVENGALCVDDGAGNCDDASRSAGTIYAESTSITAIDLAENYPTLDATLMAGEVVALDLHNPVFVRRATGAAGEKLIGVVSTAPGLLLGGFNQQQFATFRQVPVALAGRVPVRVTTSGGTINVGDPLTIGSAGIARKAQSGEQEIGYALEVFTGAHLGSIQVFVHLGDVDNAAISQSGSVVEIHSEETDGSNDALRIVTNTGSPENTVLRVSASGSVYVDGVYNSQGADYAEWFYSGESIAPGEVVCINVARANSVKRCDRDGDGNVMGIVSTNPAFVGNVISGAEGIIPPGYSLIGLIGQVPAKVTAENGAIRPGDSLTAASIPGFARKANAGESTVGVALEPLEEGTGVINVLISRRNQSVTVEAVEDKILETIANMEIEDEVELMVAGTIQDLDVEGQIQSEVERQLSSFIDQRELLTLLQAEVSLLKEKLGEIQTQSGSTHYQLPTTNSLDSLTIEDTLVTGKDVRVGGDLHLDGSLHASELFVPGGLTIDGGVTVRGALSLQGNLAVDTLHTLSGATIDGTLRIGGTIELTDGQLRFGSGTVSLDRLIVGQGLFVLGDITIQGVAHFLSNVEVQGELIVSAKQAGFLAIPESGTAVTVLFGTGFHATPVVTATPNGYVQGAWWVGVPTQTGFTLFLKEPAVSPVIFSWIALGTIAAQVDLPIEGEESLDNIAFPLDSAGIPVSSSVVWNACIRNVTLLDETGQPLSCARYHSDRTWSHPDLGIDFLWNASVTPPILEVPEGYTPMVTRDAEAVVAEFNSSAEPVATAEDDTTEPEQVPTSAQATPEGSISAESSDQEATPESVEGEAVPSADDPQQTAPQEGNTLLGDVLLEGEMTSDEAVPSEASSEPVPSEQSDTQEPSSTEATSEMAPEAVQP